MASRTYSNSYWDDDRTPEVVGPGVRVGGTHYVRRGGTRRRGVRSFALMVGGINVLALAIQILGQAFNLQEPWAAATWVQEVAEGALQVGGAALVWWLAGKRGIGLRAVYVGSALLFLGTAAVSTWYDTLFLLERNFVLWPSWICLLVLVHALLVLAPLRYHVVTLVAATVALPIGALIAWLAGAYGGVSFASVMTLAMTASIPTWVCVLAAVMVVYETRQRVELLRQARHTIRDLASYELVEPLGQGGMGEVWVARHQLMARPVALKLIRSDRFRVADSDAHDSVDRLERALQRFEREARATSALTSAHTIRIFDVGHFGRESVFYTMELLEGLDLDTLVSQHGPQPEERVRHLLIQACDSLAEAHSVGLVHRDIKPANLFLCRKGRIWDFLKVLDFGLVLTQAWDVGDAARTSDHHRLTDIDRVQGTPNFMAPEQVMQEELDARSDIYALGCVAYFCLTGYDLFPSDRAMRVMLSHVHDAPVPIHERNAANAVSPAFEELIMQCLAKGRDERPASMEVLRERLIALRLPRPWTQVDAREWHEANVASQDGSSALGPESTRDLRPQTGPVRTSTLD